MSAGKWIACILIDLFDFTIGRILIGIPIGEVIGVIAVGVMFGWKGLFYLLEVLDPTEILDGFIPSATIIGVLSNKH